MKPVLLFCLILTTALFLGQGHANPVEVDIPGPDANEIDSDLDSDEETPDKPLRIVSIKVRHIEADAALCAQQSPKHPHHPQCHSYCKRQGHWIGQCKKETCHCFS
ncbi:uncharacterized protein [Drosophila takahashii]|uniref:uncharacterized protein n=1 Tax=Drosophila takahashii TaxID=29030 RepID=UPI001CF7F9DC|nr:uncharacterized protein LOC108057251 [Drosophila takahashii]